MSNSSHFKDKVIWITGASSGIGEEMCYQFSRLGAKLIISARNESRLHEVNNHLPVSPGSATVLSLDLDKVSDLEQKVEEAIATYGKVDYLINNAGMAVRDYAKDTNLEVDQMLMNINYFGAIALTKGLLPHFEERKFGHIVVMSSLSGKHGVPKLAAYAAPKHALHGFYETLRSELIDSGINITILVPGIIKTDITAHAVVGSGESYGQIQQAFRNAYPVDKAVSKMIKAIQKRKEEYYVGGSEGITLWINRISPWFLRRFIRNHPLKRFRRIKSWLKFWK